MKLYILSGAQISIQTPLSEEWMTSPVAHNKVYNRALEAEYRDFIPAMEARRMGKVLKRAIATSLTALDKAELNYPDAILTGTGLGCIEHTEKFLSSMVKEGEEFLNPTYFMQSTHNTISSQIALRLKCHSYNTTYSHQGISFESALMDACQQFQLGKINNALVGGHDEMTPAYFELLDKINFWKKEKTLNEEILKKADTAGSISGETALSMVLSADKTSSGLCVMHGMDLMHKPSDERLKETLENLLDEAEIGIENVDAVVLGYNGDKSNDDYYRSLSEKLYPGIPQLWYKNIFGESFTVSGIGLYATAECLHARHIPEFFVYDSREKLIPKEPKYIIFHHQSGQRNHFITLLSSWDVC